ncbi:hypothetical protein CHARACLAT_019764 [Characodon lateralis]|uniref:Uncharacterized protein n=1 Tax=Characodon lateralis TaxID=208331 RepID=A0ABU7D367_9TELE|nr:hypothetical protein [Characodon lateralis]
MKTQASQSYLGWPGRDSPFSQRSCPVSQPFIKERKNTHVTASWVWLHTVSQIQVLLNKTGSGQILIQHTHPHLASNDMEIGWGANNLLPKLLRTHTGSCSVCIATTQMQL